jgi:hypothetical protein
MITLIVEVNRDLAIFFLFFVVLIIFMTTILNVVATNHQREYKVLGNFLANIVTVIRFSLGDFNDIKMVKGFKNFPHT